MAATAEAFRYPPLPDATQWIRILYLQPSTRLDNPLRGRLVETKLDAHADYHAISYLWGDTKALLTDWCELRMATTGASDAEGDYGRLPILPSCNTVLRQLRWARKTRALWIDSVCIDQSNSAEKSQQVRIMQYIYRDASKVAMWLDLSHIPTPRCKRVFKWAKMLARAHRWGLVDIFEKTHATSIFGRCFARSLPHDIKYGYHWQPFTETLLSILDSPYFGRTWTVQELVMAPLSQIEMHSCVGTVQWAHILALVEFNLAGGVFEVAHDERVLRVHRCLSCRGSFMKDNPPLRNSLKKSQARSENRIINLWDAEGPVYPFQDIPSLLASEPRDKAYAFLWALKRCRPADFDVFDVDYTKTVEIVFTEFTIAVAYETGNFVALFQSACQQDKMYKLPSWVPDWSQTPRFQEWNFLRPVEALRIIGRFETPQLNEKEGLTFQGATMRIRGLRQADHVSRVEHVPALASTESLDGGIDLHKYNPHAIETLFVALNKVFQMLDDADGLASLSKFYVSAMAGRFERSFMDPGFECLVPGALEKPYTMNYTILRGIIRSYFQAKRSPDPSDVDVDQWSRGLIAEFTNLLTEETIESLLLELSSYRDDPHSTLDTGDISTHIVTTLINSSTFSTRNVFMNQQVQVFASGSMGITIFRTEGGNIGSGQANIDVGDEVIQWKGIARPIVVRKLETGKDPESHPEKIRCRLVSVAKVDGLEGAEEDWREEDLITYIVL